MRRFFIISVLLLLFPVRLFCQVDSLALARTMDMLDNYVKALESEDTDSKAAECDFLIDSCKDSLLRQYVALKLYRHYLDSQIMGEEAVAIHIFDLWFSDDKVVMPYDEKVKGALFAEYNRQSLLGMKAPVLVMSGPDDEEITVSGNKDRRTVLFFYDTSCAKCKLESMLLSVWLREQDAELDFYAIYTGSDMDSWKSFIDTYLDFRSDKVTLVHAWDPEVRSDFQRLYGILQTPRMFLLDRRGVIVGRRLTTEALRQLVEMGTMDDELMDRNPVGGTLPSMMLEGTLWTARKKVEKTVDIRSLKGRPAYLMLYSVSCRNCKEEMEAMKSVLKSGVRVFTVDVDRMMAGHPSLATELFDSFDLTLMPHVIKLDSKGRIVDKYVSFKK